MESYKITCCCGKVEVTMESLPRVQGHSHCGDCRELLYVDDLPKKD